MHVMCTHVSTCSLHVTCMLYAHYIYNLSRAGGQLGQKRELFLCLDRINKLKLFLSTQFAVTKD